MTKPRVRFRERQRLTAGDLLAEQEYQVAAAGRHHLGHHDWGVVRGLGIYKEDTDWFVQTGMAVDGYGREIILPQRVQLGLDGGGPYRVVLYYCEEPWPEHSSAHCVPEPAPRIRQTGRVIVRAVANEPWSDPRDWPPTPIANATAAGGVGQLPPWPVVLGTITSTTDDNPQLGEVRYLRARASGVRAPSGRAVMKIGRRALSDRYHFAVATKDEQGVETDRFTIDRDGVLRFVRTLAILGDQSSTLVPLTSTAFLQISALHPGIPSAPLQVSVRIVPDKGKEILEVLASRRERSATVTHLARFDLTKAFSRKKPSQAQLRAMERAGNRTIPIVGIKAAKRKTPGSPLLNFKLVDAQGRPYAIPPQRERREVAELAAIVQNPPIRRRVVEVLSGAIRVEPPKEGHPLATQFAARLQPGGGKISLQKRTEAPPPAEEDALCNDLRRQDIPDHSAPGGAIRFRPGGGPPSRPLTRFLYTRRQATTEGITDELQAGLGLALASDFKVRLAVGSRDLESGFAPWLAIAGNGGVTIPLVTDPSTAASIPTLLEVSGTLLLPPVKAVPTDPLFNMLLLLGYIYGLRSVGGASQVVAIGFLNLGDTAVGADLTFKIHITALATAGVTVKSAVIALVLPGGTRLRSRVLIPPDSLPVDLDVTEPIDVAEAKGPFYVEVSLRLGISNLEAGATARSDSFAIT